MNDNARLTIVDSLETGEIVEVKVYGIPTNIIPGDSVAATLRSMAQRLDGRSDAHSWRITGEVDPVEIVHAEGMRGAMFDVGFSEAKSMAIRLVDNYSHELGTGNRAALILLLRSMEKAK